MGLSVQGQLQEKSINPIMPSFTPWDQAWQQSPQAASCQYLPQGSLGCIKPLLHQVSPHFDHD